MRTLTEINLLELRQKYKDYLCFLKALPIVPLQEFKRVYLRFQMCEMVLTEYRSIYKYKDIA